MVFMTKLSYLQTDSGKKDKFLRMTRLFFPSLGHPRHAPISSSASVSSALYPRARRRTKSKTVLDKTEINITYAQGPTRLSTALGFPWLFHKL